MSKPVLHKRSEAACCGAATRPAGPGPPSVAEERRQRDLSVGSADRNGQLFVALRPRPSLLSSRAGKLRRDEGTRSAAHAVQLRPVAQGRRTRKGTAATRRRHRQRSRGGHHRDHCLHPTRIKPRSSLLHHERRCQHSSRSRWLAPPRPAESWPGPLMRRLRHLDVLGRPGLTPAHSPHCCCGSRGCGWRPTWSPPRARRRSDRTCGPRPPRVEARRP